MPYTCPQCGATYDADETCEDRFNVSQAREFADPAYFAVHHLSVPCFLLQHNRYSREGWRATRQLLASFLDGRTPDAARRQQHEAMDSGKRGFSFTKGPTLAGVDAIAWTRTIAENRLDTAAHHCADMRAWAESVVRDTEALMRTIEDAG